MRIVLGVGGGIAGYKAVELVRLLTTAGHRVQVVMTKAAQQFIQPLTFATLTGERVITDLFSADSPADTLSSAVEHISVALDNEVLLVAPATADLIGKFAHGLADDFLSTLHLAFRGPVLLAPTMNTAMWEHPATKANLQLLKERGVHVIDPNSGWLACGVVGAGRLPDPVDIAAWVQTFGTQRTDFAGESVLVTAGPTQEAVDPVRYLTNRSSGKMGYALAEAAQARGADVTLISGPVSLPTPRFVQRIAIRSAREMRDAVLQHLPQASIIIKAAAVSDYTVSEVSPHKIKKTAARLNLELEPTPDILSEVGQRKGDRILVGFAAETENLLEESRRKLLAKNCDMLVGNLVNREGIGFESDQNEVEVVTRNHANVHIGPDDKRQVADRVLDEIAMLRLSLRSMDRPA